MEKLKVSSLKDGDVIAWNEVSRRYHIVRTAEVDRVSGRNIWTKSGSVLWAPDLFRLRIASETDIQDTR